MEVLLRGHGGYGGATAIIVRCHGGHGGAAATPLQIAPTRDGTSEVLNMLKVSAVPPRRSAVLTVFGGATAINDATTAEPRRSWRCHCDLCRTSTAVAPRLRCDGGINYETNLCFAFYVVCIRLSCDLLPTCFNCIIPHLIAFHSQFKWTF